MGILNDSEPHSMRDVNVRERRRAMLTKPHIAPLTAYAAKLRQRGFIEVPEFDPLDGGVNAQVLFLFEKPGPMTAEAGGSGFISRNNDDPTAEATFHFMEQAGIPRELTITWNVIPWWNGTRNVTGQELLWMMHSAESGSEDFEHAKAELENRRKRNVEQVLVPNLEWSSVISAQRGISSRCPFASVELCPRYFLSVAVLGKAGLTTKIQGDEDARLAHKWEQHPLWPRTGEQDPEVLSFNDKSSSFSQFCPEVMFDIFGLFATHLGRYADELDRDLAHRGLREKAATPSDWRWQWASMAEMHYSDCPLYSPLRYASNSASMVSPKIVELKPSFHGITLDLHALWHKLVSIWKSWSLLRKALLVGILLAVAIVSTSIGMSSIFVRSVVFSVLRRQSGDVVPNVVVRFSNSGKDDTLIYPRGEFLLWLPQGVAASAPTIAGVYELLPPNKSLVQNGMILLRPGQTTTVSARIMNQEGFSTMLKRGDTDLTFVFRKANGGVFMSQNLPFTQQAIATFAAGADCAEQ
jgi:hypothetical protein